MRWLGIPLSRPIAVGSIYATLLLVGVAALRELPIGLAPDLDLPRISVQLGWPNATPQEMEALITSRVESEMQLIRGVEELSSVSGPGWSVVEVAFARDTDLDLAEVFVRERLGAMRDDLPDDVSPPTLTRAMPRGVEGGDFLLFQASGPYTAEAMREMLEERVLPRLLATPGVAGAELYGGVPRAIRVDLDRDAVEQGIVRPADLTRALDRIGGTRPVGSVQHDGRRLPVVVERPRTGAESVRDAVVGTRGTVPVRVRDVARVHDTWAEPRRISRLDGQPSVQVVLEREPGTNVIRVAGAVAQVLEEVTPGLPSGVVIETLYDQSETIHNELDTLIKRSAISVVGILIVLLVFNRRLRASVGVLASVLFSALVTFLLFRVAGLGMNLVTLSGLALAFGMAVDNSIVILENIALRTRGRSSGPAAGGRLNRLRTLAATREVVFPLLAATLTTAVVLMPFLYLSGDLRDYYLPFALAVCLSLSASMAVALTLTPVLARWGLGSGAVRRTDTASSAGGQRGMRRRPMRAYNALLAHLVARPWIPAVVAALLLGGSFWIFDTQVSRGSIFPPQTDTQLRVFVEFPPGTEIHQVDALIGEFEQLALTHPFRAKGYIDQVVAHVQERVGTLTVRFHPAVARSSVPETLRDDMTVRAAAVSGISISVMGQGPGYSTGGASVSPSYRLDLTGPDYPVLDGLTTDVANRLRRNGRVKNVDTYMSGLMVKGAVSLAVVPDRERLARMGVSMRDLVMALQPAIAGDLATRPLPDPRGEVETSVRLGGGDALTPVDLGRTLMNHPGVSPFPFGDVLTVEERPLQDQIRRRDQQYERTVGFEYRGPRKVGNRFVRSLTENTQLPPGYAMSDGFGLVLSKREEREIWIALGLAVLLVYMVSAALFESLLLPFVAILSVPLSFVGIALAFWLTGEPFDRTAYVGLILLAGIAINNALLLVHRAGAISRHGIDAATAAIRAARERVRPILMTTATSVVALLPLAWEADPTAVAGWRSLALAGTGGLIASTLFTLTIIPALFVLLRPRRRGISPLAPEPALAGSGAMS